MAPALDYDAIVIGTGIADLYPLIGLRELGMQVAGFPNLLMVMGPHSVRGNIPRSIEYNVEWASGLLRHLCERDLTRVEARPESIGSWAHCNAVAAGGYRELQLD